MFNNSKSSLRSGQALWEMVVALAITGLIVLGLVRLTAIAVKSTRFSKDESLATALAQKKIASIIASKDDDPNSFWNLIEGQAEIKLSEEFDGQYCLYTKLVNKSSDLPTQTPNFSSARMAQIWVDIFWDQKGSDTACKSANFSHSLHFDTYVTN